MEHFFPLVFKIISLYLNIFLGFIAAKVLATPREAIAKLMFYIINPIVIFNGILNTQITGAVLFLPFLVFTICSLLCFIFYQIGRSIWTDSTKNLLGFSAGSGNAGYFGLPVAILLFNDQTEGVYIMGLMGMTLYESTVGYYTLAKGLYKAKECVKRVVTLPSVYALLLALLLNREEVSLPFFLKDFMIHIKGTYTVLGMMIIGLGMAKLREFKVDWNFIGLTTLARFCVWPLLTFIIIATDKMFLGIMDPAIYNALTLLSIVPLGVSTVILASVLNTHPEKASSAVLISTLIGSFLVPLFASFLF